MIVVSVIYPRSHGTEFDYDYYEENHLPLLTQRWGGAGLIGAEALRGTTAPDGGDAPYFAIALLRFESREAMGAALGGEHAEEVMGDIPKFTNVQPVVQINEPIGNGG
jgi:uncharacterized protein (TIGR02118 family)